MTEWKPVAYVGAHPKRRRWKRMPRIWQRAFHRRVQHLEAVLRDNPWIVWV